MRKIAITVLLYFLSLTAWSQNPTASQNYVIETQVKVANKTTVSMLTGLPVSQANRIIHYVDGLGRPLQSVQWQASPLGKDLVQHFQYDAYGREVKSYLPYAEQSSNDGSFKTNALGNLSSFYTNGTSWDANVAKTSYPFSETVYELSPLNRTLEQGAPGYTWQRAGSRTATTGRTVAMAYGTNTSSEVRLWVVNSTGATASAYYPAGTLYKTVTRDENWVSGKAGTVAEFKDLANRLVLKRTWSSESDSLNTYYIYDKAYSLRYVVPPAVTANSFAQNDAIFDQFIYGYLYDGRKRLIEKKVPGKGWEYLVYNKLDQVIFTQDANQRATYQWTFNKYDALGRVILTGFYQRNSGRAAFQTYVLNLGLPLWETRDNGAPTGYTNVSYPNASVTANLTASYYDDYAFVGASPSVNVSNKVNGMLTGTRVYLADGTLPRWTIYYYDDEGRARETIAENNLGGADRYISNHNFAGELTASTRLHVALGNTTVIDNVYTYDPIGRQLDSKMNINSLGEVVMSRASYNEVGQLKQKQLHSDDAGASFLHSAKFSRNERGWLKNSASAQFSFKLGYDTLASPQYNGNISTQLWGAAGSYPNSFLYSYDKLNRLANGTSTGIAMSEVLTYNAMGNITTLSRDNGTASIYFYTGNRLSHVDGVTNPYSYDANGNTTIDGRMNLTQAYNHLNLLRHATTTNLNVYYTYNALGVKLKREVLTTGMLTTDYVDGIQYTNGAIDFIQTTEGRAKKTGGSYVYEYNLTDHLGNVRYSFDKNAGILRKLQADDYYPFGLRKVATSGSNPYLYNSKELQTELGKYDYGARMYDPIIGRWNSVDPLGEKYKDWSPYTFVLNNPIKFIDPNGNDVIPSKAFLNTPYGKAFQDLRKNNSFFRGAIAKYENNKKFNLMLYANDAKVKAGGAYALTNVLSEKKSAPTSFDTKAYYKTNTDIPSTADYKISEIGVALVVAHEAIHQKIALTSKNEDDMHNAFNSERKTLMSILTEYSADNKLNLTSNDITVLSFSGQQDSKEFKKYITDLSNSNKTNYKEEKDKYDTSLSRLFYEKK